MDKILNHTAAHVLAYAVKNIYPNTKLAIGPATDSGFYYDFDFATPIKDEDLVKIEAEMSRIIKENFNHFRKFFIIDISIFHWKSHTSKTKVFHRKSSL